MESVFKWSLIGKFTTGRPQMMDILIAMKHSINFQDEILPVALDSRHVMVRFQIVKTLLKPILDKPSS